MALGQMTLEEWIQAQQIIDSICADPSVDNVVKFEVYRPPSVYRYYFDPPFKITYRLASPVHIYIMSIRAAENVPPLSEWDDWLKGDL